MLKGINLTLMIGPAVPVPVPKEVLDALTSVQVQIGSGAPQASRPDLPAAVQRIESGFELTFRLSTRSPLHTLFLVSGGASIPLVRVVIVVTVNGTPEVLMDGVMTDHRVTPGDAPGQATLTVFGKDLTTVMSYLDFSGIPYPAMPRAARVALIVAKYAALGIVPLAIPAVLDEVPLLTNQIPQQIGSDLEYIQKLADQVGYVFYLDPGPAPGVSVAYWGPEIRVGVPQPALSINMDAHTNVEALSFSYNREAAKSPIVFILNEVTKLPIPIPVPDITPLNPPLGLIPPVRIVDERSTDTAGKSPVDAAARALAKAARSSQAVSGNGTLNVLRYGRILKARQLVGVRGAGTAFNGLYYVKSVTHNIQRGQYTQDFELTRNGLISTVPRVPV